jgi:hypothetical protein
MPQRIPARIELKPAQRAALEALGNGGLRELTRSAYQELTGMSRSQAAYDLAELVEAGVLDRVGSGRSTRYRLVRDSDPRQRQWTDGRIRDELARFCAGRKTWPSAQEFKGAGRTDLYVAASRYGGIGFWAAELGLPRGGNGVPPLRSPALFRRLSWAVVGAAAGAAVVAVGLGVVRDRPARSPAVAAKSAAAGTNAQAPARQARPARTTARRRSPTGTLRAGGAARPPAAARAKQVSPAPTVSRPVRVSPPPPPSREPSRVVLASTPPPPGPTPLAAPQSSGPAPPPLPAP